MIKKPEKTVTFADVWLGHTEKQWKHHWLNKVLDKVNFNKFRYRFEKLYDEANGRPASLGGGTISEAQRKPLIGQMVKRFSRNGADFTGASMIPEGNSFLK